MAYLDYNGLSHFLDKLKSIFVQKTDNVDSILEYNVSIPVDGWTHSQNTYSYVWENANIISRTHYDVVFLDGVRNAYIGDISTEMATGSITFTTSVQPLAAVSVRVRLYNAFVFSEYALPAVTAADNGKFLRVENGEWTSSEVHDATGVSF